MSREELERRLLKRGRADDKTEIILRRFDVFNENQPPVTLLLEQNGISTILIDGNKSEDQVYQSIKQQIDNFG